MRPARPFLGTLLRHLIDLLDGAVQEVYDDAGLEYRPRYTPVVAALEAIGPSSIRAIADHAGMTHSAVSQTVAQMARAGLIELIAGRDARERVATPSATLTEMMPALRRLWNATARAARELDDELACPLSGAALEAIRVLETRPFGDRIRQVDFASC